MNYQQWLAVAIASLVTACGGKAPTQPERIQVVDTITLTQSKQVKERFFTGQVVLADLTPMGFRIEGKITEINIRPGQKVVEGELLAQIDDSSTRQQWQDANAQHQLLLRNLKRSKPLLQKGLMAQSEYDELNAKVQLAKVNLGIAAARLSYTKLLAPFDGVIDSLDKETYETAAAGETVLSLYRNNRTDVEMEIPDTLLLLSSGRHRDRNYHPLVSSETAVDPVPMDYLEHAMKLEPEIGAFTVRLTTSEQTPLIPGEAVQIRLNVEAAGLPEIHGFQVPLSAIQASAAGEAFQVWKVQQGIVQPYAVAIERMNQQGALINGELSEGDQLIVSGLSQLRPNQQVNVIAKESQR